MENAAIRENFASSIYCSGVSVAKTQVLDSLPTDLAQLHRAGDIHIHDLEAFGKLYNCCTPDLCKYLLQRSYPARSDYGKIMQVFEEIKLLIIQLAVVQSGGIGFGNFDIDMEQVFQTLTLEKNEDTTAFLDEAMEGFIAWINRTRTRFCRETYYLTINLGLAQGFWGRAITQSLIQGFLRSPAGYTKPNIVFKVVNRINGQPGTVNFDLYQLALRCTAARMIPTYLLMDSAPNCVCNPKLLNIMGCRTRVYDNTAGEAGTVGRGNIAYTSINLPRIALSCQSIEAFYRRLEHLMKACCRLVSIRNDQMTQAERQYVDFALKKGIWRSTTNLDNLLRQGTYSIGFIGLSETVELLTGEKMYHSQAGKALAMEIVETMNTFIMNRRSITGMNWSLLATPGEMISGRFCTLDREHFPHPIQDKGFYTNSFHVDVDSGLTPFEKLAFEGPFHALCTGGSISYVEFSSALLENAQAISDVLSVATEHGISYLGINFPLDICENCGQNGTFDQCPHCGSWNVTHIRRVSGYLEDAAFFTDGKKSRGRFPPPQCQRINKHFE